MSNEEETTHEEQEPQPSKAARLLATLALLGGAGMGPMAEGPRGQASGAIRARIPKRARQRTKRRRGR